MMKAPVGPPICTRLPPNNDTMKPATIAVMSPFSGDTPDATPNAMAKGRATMPTTIPAMMSRPTCSLDMPLRRSVKSLGLNTDSIFPIYYTKKYARHLSGVDFRAKV